MAKLLSILLVSLLCTAIVQAAKTRSCTANAAALKGFNVNCGGCVALKTEGRSITCETCAKSYKPSGGEIATSNLQGQESLDVSSLCKKIAVVSAKDGNISQQTPNAVDFVKPAKPAKTHKKSKSLGDDIEPATPAVDQDPSTAGQNEQGEPKKKNKNKSNKKKRNNKKNKNGGKNKSKKNKNKKETDANGENQQTAPTQETAAPATAAPALGWSKRFLGRRRF